MTLQKELKGASAAIDSINLICAEPLNLKLKNNNYHEQNPIFRH